MVRSKLAELKIEISHYLGIPYFTNTGKYKNSGENSLVGKGTAQEITLKTVEFSNNEKLHIINFSPQELYNFQKKYHLGIDCSGLVSNLLNYYGTSLGIEINLNPRRTSADNLTSHPLAHQTTDLKHLQTGDLVRQKNGQHVLFIIEIIGNIVYYVESSHSGRGVTNGHFSLEDKTFIYDGIYRLFLLD